MELSNYRLLDRDIKKNSKANYSFASGDEQVYRECAEKTGFVTLPPQQMQQLGLSNSESTKKAFDDCVKSHGKKNIWDTLEDNAGNILNLGSSIINWASNKKNNNNQSANNQNTGGQGASNQGGENYGGNDDYSENDKFLGMPKPVGIIVSIVGILAIGSVIGFGIKAIIKKGK